MVHNSPDPRTSDTKDLSASLRSKKRPCMIGRVLNLGEDGMLVAINTDLEVGEIAGVELSGPGFCYAGIAEVAHREDGAMGLRFVSWQGPVDRLVHALVSGRLSGQPVGSHHAGELGIGRATVWDSREHGRAALSGLSAVIEESPGGTTRRHPVLNVSEQGIQIDGLALGVGARISFLLEGRGINHIGRGHVAHRTGTILGVAVDHWHGAPETIRALISGEAELGLPLTDAYVTEWS